jgi:hypothetical protein
MVLVVLSAGHPSAFPFRLENLENLQSLIVRLVLFGSLFSSGSALLLPDWKGAVVHTRGATVA